jgi:HSP20 family protein
MITGWQREVDRLFDDFRQGFDRLGHLTPRLDMSESPTELEITAELPGLEEKDVEIALSDDVLTISGEKQAESEQKDRNRHLVERSYGVGAADISASLTKGVLKVVVRKPEPTPSTKIQIKTA